MRLVHVIRLRYERERHEVTLAGRYRPDPCPRGVPAVVEVPWHPYGAVVDEQAMWWLADALVWASAVDVRGSGEVAADLACRLPRQLEEACRRAARNGWPL